MQVPPTQISRIRYGLSTDLALILVELPDAHSVGALSYILFLAGVEPNSQLPQSFYLAAGLLPCTLHHFFKGHSKHLVCQVIDEACEPCVH
eukprot:10121757-Lingulodinium_polyedra.AAC.1